MVRVIKADQKLNESFENPTQRTRCGRAFPAEEPRRVMGGNGKKYKGTSFLVHSVSKVCPTSSYIYVLTPKFRNLTAVR